MCTTESTVNTYTKSRATKYKMQLKFCAKSYLPARINSHTLESISALFPCQIAHAQAYEKVIIPQVWESHAIVPCCFVNLFSNTLYVF